jgi:hypothetical protein
MIHLNQPINYYDNSNPLLHIGAILHEERTFEAEEKEIFVIKARDEQAIRYFKALREIEFIMVRI